jgi:hypothetical protein
MLNWTTARLPSLKTSAPCNKTDGLEIGLAESAFFPILLE